MDGFRQFRFQPNTRAAVLVLVCSTVRSGDKLQDFALPTYGLVTNILSFNVGVEIGQVLALMGVLVALSYWRISGFLRHAFVTNTALMAGGSPRRLPAGHDAMTR
jgi:hypothetical protein